MTPRLSFEEYRRIGAVNWSSLKSMLVSPLQYSYDLAHPRRDTPAMRFGRAVHCSALEPTEFPLRYGVVDDAFLARRDLNRATKEGKAAWGAWLERHPNDADLDPDEYKRAVWAESNPGREMLAADDWRSAVAIGEAVRNHPAAQPYLFGPTEVTLEWTDEATGIKCKCRLDRKLPASIVDFKTAASISEREFSAACYYRGYYGQAAFYCNGWAATHGGEVHPFVFLAVEAAPPHDVAAFPLDDDSLYRGEQTVARLLRRLAECRASNQWPGRYPEPRPLRLPAFAFTDGDQEGVDNLAAASEAALLGG